MEMKEKAMGTGKYFFMVRKKKYIAIRNNSRDLGIRERVGRGRGWQAGGQTQPWLVFPCGNMNLALAGPSNV